MKPACITDASSVIYLSKLAIGERTIIEWLDSEFDIHFSETVWNEITRNKHRLGDSRYAVRQMGPRTWMSTKTRSYELALFERPYPRREQITLCKICRQPIFADRLYDPDITIEEDRGERHNCCVALEMILSGKYHQVIYLTDDYPAQRNYVEPVFNIIPLGNVWTSFDVVLYLFTRHRDRITPDTAKNLLRTVNAIAISSNIPNEQTKQKFTARLGNYFKRVDGIERTLLQIRG